MLLQPWVKLPNRWIEDGGLHQFRWTHGQGADELAALLALAVISHHADATTGVAYLTYSRMGEVTGLSRAKLSAGLSVLEERSLIERQPAGRSSYRIEDYNPQVGWAQFPARGLYKNGVIPTFTDLNLRHRAELDALKLYYLFASRRDRNTNKAHISYLTIEEYSGVHHDSIRRALSLLAVAGLVHVEQGSSGQYEGGVSNAYRLAHLHPRSHAGTTGRRDQDWLLEG